MSTSEVDQLSAMEKEGSINPAQRTRLTELRGSSAGGSSSNPYGNPDIGAALSNQRAGDNALLSSQQSQNSDFLSRFRSAISGQEGVPAMATRIGSELGLPALQSNANYLNTQVQNMPFTQKALTTGFDVNQNQLNNLINKKVTDLTPAMNSANNAYSSAQQSLDKQMGYTQQQQAKELQPYSVEQTQLADSQARAATMYSQENQNELTSLLQKQQLGYQWDENEKNRAQQLAMQEASFENAKQMAQMQIDAQQQQQQPQYLNGSQFYDTKTGTWITAPKTGTGSSFDISKYLVPQVQAAGNGQGSNGRITSPKPQMSANQGTMQNGWYSTGNDWIKVIP